MRALGYTTIAASNAAEALAEVRSNTNIDLLFTDIIMPGKTDGWQLAELVKQMRPDIKISVHERLFEFQLRADRIQPGTVASRKALSAFGACPDASQALEA